MNKKSDLTTPCGLDCFKCELYIENLTDELAEVLNKNGSVKRRSRMKRLRAAVR
jgi:hypothetical protein